MAVMHSVVLLTLTRHSIVSVIGCYSCKLLDCNDTNAYYLTIRLLFSEFRVISQIWEATMAKRIDLFRPRQNCSHYKCTVYSCISRKIYNNILT